MRTRERAFHALVVIAIALCALPVAFAQRSDRTPEPASAASRVPDGAGQDARRAEKRRLSGRSIADRIMTQLREDALVPLDDLGVVVVDGEVTLSGTVPSLLARSRAERLSERVRGVKTVKNKLSVKPDRPYSDKQVEVYVGHALATDPATDDLALEARVNQGVVTLKGTVASAAERALAREVASDVFGARDVKVSELKVVRPSDAPPASEIEREVSRALDWDSRVDADDIEVSVDDDGRVTLRGTVASAAARRHAIGDAEIPGVIDVDARGLRVAPDKRRRVAPAELRELEDEPPLTVARPPVPPLKTKLDVSLRRAAERRFRSHPRLDTSTIRVEADDGVLTLRGTVDSLKARRSATEVSRSLYGVSLVRNRLRVDPTLGPMAAVETDEAADVSSPAQVSLTPPADSDVVDDVERALRRDPYLSERSIRVDVVDGEAYLEGAVTSAFEKMRADDLAARTRGVIDVHNELRVQGDARTQLAPLGLDDAPYLYEWYVEAPRGTERGDEDLKAALEEQLFWSPAVDAADVRASVADGFVRLDGTVQSWEERDAAARSAYAAGALRVDNRLQLEGG